MKYHNRTKASRTVRRVWLATIAVAAVGGAGIVAGHGNATPQLRAERGPYAPKGGKVKAKLDHGVLTVRGTKASDKIALRMQAGEPGILQIDVGDDGSADFSIERSNVAKIVVSARAGNDAVRIDESDGVFTDTIPTTIDGGSGSDTIAGGKGIETLLGGGGNDSIDGNGGNDLALLGAGNDTFVWDPGDGSDTVGGADVVTVNDLSGTDVASLNVDLAGALGGAAGDGQPDRVVVNGTNGEDSINVNGDTGGVKVSGLAPTVKILHSEAANDRLEINTLDGRDSVDSGGLAAGAIQLFVDGIVVP